MYGLAGAQDGLDGYDRMRLQIDNAVSNLGKVAMVGRRLAENIQVGCSDHAMARWPDGPMARWPDGPMQPAATARGPSHPTPVTLTSATPHTRHPPRPTG